MVTADVVLKRRTRVERMDLSQLAKPTLRIVNRAS